MSSADRRVVVNPVSHSRMKPLARVLSALAGLAPVLVWAQLPGGGQVVAGSAVISQPDANHLVVQQGSAKAILNWQQFSIGEQGYVQFIQPGASAIAFNRVVGADPSAILGQLSANGQVFLINPNGVLFGAGARVDVAGLVATTMNITDEQFLAGDFRFEHAASKVDGAQVVNAGTINAAKGGYVVLAGDYVANQGVIQTQAGTALLAAGNALTLQLSGSGLIDYAVEEATLAELAGVDNAGQILASGGRVIMTAKVANDLAATVVNNSGLVQAQSTVEHDGVIYLVGEGGDIANAGKLDASAQAGSHGGHVEIRSSGDIQHRAGSVIDINGADSGVSNAGSLYTWADGSNRFVQGAAIEGKGGADGGNGADVELSGRSVQIAGSVDLRAPKGNGGTILIDPVNITIANQDNTAAGGSTVGELWIESQLNSGVNVSILADGGAGASITLDDLSDGVLDGTHVAGTGGSLTLTASGAGASITFANTANTIRVDRNLTLDANNGAGGHTGTSISVGHLVAGQGNPSGGGLNNTTVWNAGLTVDAGSVTAESVTLGKAINSNTDSAYALNVRAHDGDLTINGDVTLDVANAAVGGVATSATLQADAGNITIGGAVSANASGQGYYQYNWETSGDPANSYYGQQPWTKVAEADHAITTTLSIDAGGSVAVAGTTSAEAVDTGTGFQSANTRGGFWQTANSTQHIFWRATAPQASATINAGGDATLGGAVSVKADGHVTQSYGETEAWNTMVQQVSLVSQDQQIYQSYGDHDGNAQTPNQWYNPQWVTVTNTAQGGWTGSYTWYQSGINRSGTGPYTSAQTTGWSTYNNGSVAGPMSYSNVAGPTAEFTLTAAGDVTLNGMDVTATNRSATGGGSYTDTNWGRQNTVGGNQGNYDSNSVSGAQETWWHDTFSTSYSVATADATAAITAGDNRSVALNGGVGVEYNVIAEHPNMTASGNTLASAGMTITAGSAGGASGSATVTLSGPVRVEGADDASIDFTVVNHDGGIVQASDTSIVVRNNYVAHDAAATLTSAVGDITLNDLAVYAGRAAYLSVSADQNLLLTGAQAATGSNRAEIDLTATHGALTANDTITATANSGVALIDLIGAGAVQTQAGITASSSTQSHIGITSGTATVTTDGSLLASASSGNGSADVLLAAALGATVNASVAATANNYTTTGFYPNILVNGGTAAVDISSTAGDIALNDSVTANGYMMASVDIGADGGGLSLAAGSQVAATASGGVFGFGYTAPAYSADVDLTAATGMRLDGNVAAAATNGTATTTLVTTGGSTATLAQGASSQISAQGVTATLAIQAGSAGAVNAGNAAQLDMRGALTATAGSGQAVLDIDGAGGTLGAITAQSTGNTATATIDVFDADGLLALTGISGVYANSNSANAADLAINAAGGLNATAADFTVRNNNSSAGAGARAVVAADGDLSTGALAASSNGGGAVSATFTATGDVLVDGYVNATATIGGATTAVTSSGGKVTIGSGAGASANAGNSAASTTVSGASGVVANGLVSSGAGNGAASATLISSAGDVQVASGVVISAGNTGDNADVNISGATGVAFAGVGGVTATGGDASAQLSSASGAVTVTGTFATSAGGTSMMTVDGATAVDVDGDLQVSGTGAATLDATSTGDMAFGGSIAVTSSLADALLSLTGSGDVTVAGTVAVSGVADNASGAQFDVSGASVDSRTATVTVVNHHVSANAGALAQVTGGSLAQLGGIAVETKGAGAALLSVSADAIDVDGALGATAVTGGALVELAAGQGMLTTAGGSALSATTQGGAASIVLDGSDDVILDGSNSVAVAQHGHDASLRIDSAGAITLNGVTTVGAEDTASIVVDGQSITLGSGGSLTAGGIGQGATIDLLAATGLVLNGDMIVNGMGGDGAINLITRGGSSATIVQGADSSILVDGINATLTVEAGSAGMVDTTQAAAIALGGALDVFATHGDAALRIDGAGGSVHDFAVSAAGNAAATLSSYNSAGTLLLDGSGEVRGDADNASAAQLKVNAAGGLDARTATLIVANDNVGLDAGAQAQFTTAHGVNRLGTVEVGTDGSGVAAILANGSAGVSVIDLLVNGGSAASADLAATTGNVELGDVEVGAAFGATLTAAAQSGNLMVLGSGGAMTLSGSGISVSGGGALVDLLAKGDIALRDITLAGVDTILNANAQQGVLSQAMGTTTQLNASSGAATANLNGAAILMAGNVLVGSGSGAANATLQSGSTVTQGSDSLLRAKGGQAGLSVNGTTVTLGGDLQVQGGSGHATLAVGAANLDIGKFSVTATGGPALAQLGVGGNLGFNAVATVSGNHDSAQGAALIATAGGKLNGSAANLTVTNKHQGASAGALLDFISDGAMTAGPMAVVANGGGAAQLSLHSDNALTVDNNLSASALNTGAGKGSSAIVITSGDKPGAAASILQRVGSTIRARSGGNAAGDASVLIAAGACCDANVDLLGVTTAEVIGGSGNASVTVRGANVTVPGLTATATGSGNSLIDLAAPTSLTVTGLLTSQAVSPKAEAGIKLITDKLDYQGKAAALSKGNGKVQLAPFNTSWLIGVDSQPDFDSVPEMHYSRSLLQKFTNNDAEIRFGGAYDRSHWVDANGKFCVADMGEWGNIGQHTGDIHVAGAGTGHLQLLASRMVFDTTGTTYYHDNQMTPWSVPTGRTAIYVPRPTPSLDRYLDRTENALQRPVTGLESSVAKPLHVSASVIAPDGTVQIAGNMFMAGDGVNMQHIAVDGGFGGGTGGGGGSGSSGSDTRSGAGSRSGSGETTGTGAGGSPAAGSDGSSSEPREEDEESRSDS